MDLRRRRALAAVAGLAAAPLVRRARAQSQALLARPIPSTGEALPVIGLGTWQVFDVGSDKAAQAPLREVLRAFSAAGGRVVDSSPMYGTSEAVVGDLAAELGLHERLFVATKVWTSGRDEGVRQMENSFRRLRVRRMDLMQVHNLVDLATHAKTLADWKAKGRVRYVGITHYTASAYAEVERALRAGQHDFLQINYSLAERESEKRLLPIARERRVAVIVNRPFAEGAMFARVRGKALPPWAQEIGVASWAQFFLKWIVGHPAVTCAIPGTGRPDHMADNLAAGAGALPDESMRRRMAEHFASL
jgi:diketogulonate reductase-like aldo/keto reductase